MCGEHIVTIDTHIVKIVNDVLEPPDLPSDYRPASLVPEEVEYRRFQQSGEGCVIGGSCGDLHQPLDCPGTSKEVMGGCYDSLLVPHPETRGWRKLLLRPALATVS